MIATNKIVDFFGNHFLSITIFLVILTGLVLIIIPFFDGSIYYYYANYGTERQTTHMLYNSSKSGFTFLFGIIFLTEGAFFLSYRRLSARWLVPILCIEERW